MPGGQAFISRDGCAQAQFQLAETWALSGGVMVLLPVYLPLYSSVVSEAPKPRKQFYTTGSSASLSILQVGVIQYSMLRQPADNPRTFNSRLIASWITKTSPSTGEVTSIVGAAMTSKLAGESAEEFARWLSFTRS